MARSRLKSTLAGCAIALALGGVAAGCGEQEPGVDEPAREGLAIDVGGLEYNVFITRPLNTEIAPDEAYYDGPAPEAGNAFFGVFLEVCNPEDADDPLVTTGDLVVEDNQGNEFEPTELPEDNQFAYQSRELQPGDCLPADGSVAQQGPTGGTMLLFEFPLTATENRPLELTITPPAGGGEAKKVELDL